MDEVRQTSLYESELKLFNINFYQIDMIKRKIESTNIWKITTPKIIENKSGLYAFWSPRYNDWIYVGKTKNLKVRLDKHFRFSYIDINTNDIVFDIGSAFYKSVFISRNFSFDIKRILNIEIFICLINSKTERTELEKTMIKRLVPILNIQNINDQSEEEKNK